MLQGCIDIIIVVGGEFKVLFKLLNVRYDRIPLNAQPHTLNKFFSSLIDFSFLSLNLVNELLNRSKSKSCGLSMIPIIPRNDNAHLMLPFGNSLPNLFHNRLHLFCRCKDPAFNQFKLGCNKRFHLFHRSFMLCDATNGMFSL